MSKIQLNEIIEFFKDMSERRQNRVALNIYNPSIEYLNMAQSVGEEYGYVLEGSDISGDRMNIKLYFIRNLG